MDNLDIYLYIIILIVYAVARIFKAANKKPPVGTAPGKQQMPAHSPGDGGAPKKRPFSFEDILKEFEKSFQEGKEEPAFESQIPSEILPPPPVPRSKPAHKELTADSPYLTYEGQSYEDIPTYEDEGRSLEKPVYGRSEKYKIDKAEEHDIIKRIRKPGGIRDAIIFNEIITRKYF